ncbi:MAG: Rpn family recombination-promoting nuclease/putative transposase [Muribaculaceae bacterium]|nr:Rpn family recombination-promoting nuclease/putative transposase [Muribaculaceae bacterium]
MRLPLTHTFIDIRTDFGFKRLFGSPKRAHILMRFLNALFEGRMVITEVNFKDKEMLPEDPEGKRTIYDVYCTTQNGHHFILEMQMLETKNFMKRILFYTSDAIRTQLLSGENYTIQPVYSIVITDFDLSQLPKRLVNEAVFMERNSCTVVSEDVILFFVSLNQVSKAWKDCHSELERLLYLVKNMRTMSKKSEAYKSGEYKEIFDAAECDRMANEELVAYSDSYWRMLEIREAINEAAEKAAEKAKEEGIQEIRQRVLNMIKDGCTMDQLYKYLSHLTNHNE